MPNVSVERSAAAIMPTAPEEIDEKSDMLTVETAAARVGLTERTLSQILQTDTFAGRTVTEDRETEAGPRAVTLVPPPLMADLLSYYETGKAAASEDKRVSDARTAESSPPAGRTNGVQEPPPVVAEMASLAAQIASARETILRAEQARARADRERAHAEAALERARRERDTETERLSAALSRAQDALMQALTALTQEQQRTHRLETTQATLIQYLPGPQVSPEQSEEAGRTPARAPDSGPILSPGDVPPAPPAAQAEAANGGKPGLWGRLWLLLAD